MAVPTLPGWQDQILQGVGAPSTPQNMQLMNAWAQAEGGGASNNPFNTTQMAPGATAYNSAGVRNFTTPQQGIQATIDTLQNGYYPDILSSLRSGGSAMATAQAIANSPWGTGRGVLNVLGGSQGSAAPSPSPTMSPSTSSLPQIPQSMPQAPSPLALPAPTMPSASGLLTTMLGGGNVSNYLMGGGSLPNLGGGLTSMLIGQGLQQMNQAPTSTPVQQTKNAGQTVTMPTGTQATIQGKPQARDIAAVKLAESFIGTPYQWGGSSPKSGFDCSGLLQYVWGREGVQIPRTTYQQFQTGTPVAKANLQPGDAVYFTGSDPKGDLPGHVGMYIGGGKFVEAPHTGADVQVSTLAGRQDYVGARRFN